MNHIDQDKDNQRKLAKKQRALAYLSQPKAGQQACDLWCKENLLKPNQIISIYWPLGDELDPMPLLNTLHNQGHTMVLPVMQGAGKPLLFRTWEPGDTLEDASFGTQEPSADKTQLDPDVILTPLLAFDKQGFRLGYGGGFYDRTLEKIRQYKQVSVYGIAFAEQEVDKVVIGEYDQALDGIVTQNSMTYF